MPYPDDKETFRRVVNQDLPAIEGDIVDEDDQNLPADFIERLQDTLGYNIKMGHASMKAFFDDIVSQLAALKKIEFFTLYQGPGGGVRNPNDIAQFSGNINALTTDILFFQTNLIWQRTGNVVAKTRMEFLRLNTSIGTHETYSGHGEQERLTTLLTFVTSPIADGVTTWRTKLTCKDDQLIWIDLLFTCIKFSI